MEEKLRKAVPMPADNFIEEAINGDIEAGKVPDYIQTRFPPEPNGYLHIGHAKALVVDFGIAQKYGGRCNLRFDDTNPAKEDISFVENIFEDIRWLGYEWAELHYASEYFEQTYQFAEQLIQQGQAYVDELTGDQIREYRGTLTEPGKPSPWRDRPMEESLDLFRRMRAGEFEQGRYVLRAKIDMASPNLNMRDPVIYRILYAHHHQTGDAWCIYPMYDFAHPIGDALEHVTHSLCSLEYEDHRPLYDWVTHAIGFEYPPRQIEFARLNMTGTIMSKRYLRKLVEEKLVPSWDDPRMPTLRGLRRRGYTPAAIRDFLSRAGVAKAASTVDVAVLEACIREELNETAPRAMAVLDPVKLVVDNYPEGRSETFTAANHPAHPEMGERTITFSRELYIDSSDFALEPPPKYHRLKPGGEVRLMNAYIVKYESVVLNEDGSVAEVHVTYDPESAVGGANNGRKVKGTIQWVDAATSCDAEVRLYASMLTDNEGGGEHDDYMDRFNFDSLIVKQARVEGSLAGLEAGQRFQFVRLGYFVSDQDSTEALPVFNRIVSLKDSFKKKGGR